MTLRSEPDLVDATWRVLEIAEFNGGLNTSQAPHLLADNELSAVKNLIARDGLLKVDTGYSQLGVSVYDSTHQTLQGKPQAFVELVPTSGAREFICITQKTVYKLSSGGMWEVIDSGDTHGTLATNPGGGGLSITVQAGEGSLYTIGDIIGIVDDSGDVFTTEVIFKIGDTLSIDPFTPNTFSAAAGNAVHIGPVLAGTDDKPVVVTEIPSHGWIVFTNDVDAVKRYDGSTVEDLPGLVSFGITAARTVSLYNNHLHVGNVVKGGIREPQSVYWSDTGDPTNWTTGNSGFEKLFDSRAEIMAMRPLGDQHIIYSDRAITRQEFVGASNLLFFFRTMIYAPPIGLGVGPVSPNSVISHANQHFVLARDGVYVYQGGFTIERISDKVFDRIFGSGGEFDANERSIRAFSQFMDQTDELYFFYPSVSATDFCDRALIRSREGRWFRREFVDEFLGSGTKLADSGGTTIAQLVGTIAEQQWTLGGSSVSGQVPQIALAASDSKTYLYDFSSGQDDDSPIAWSMTTKEVRGLHHYFLTDRFDFLLSGMSVEVEYTTDGGVTWSTIGTVSPGLKLTMERLFQQITAERLMLRLSGTGGGPEISSAAVKLRNSARWSA